MKSKTIAEMLYAIADLERHEQTLKRSRKLFPVYLLGMARLELLQQIKELEKK